VDPGVDAGVAAYGDGNNAVGISVGGGQAIVFRLAGGTSQVIAQASSPDTVQLRMAAANGHLFTFALSADGGATWDAVGGVVNSEASSPDLPPWDRGVRAALFANGPTSAAAKFELFRMAQPALQPQP
jgi:hypothetical protein